MAPEHRTRLRTLLESLATIEPNAALSKATELEFSFRDCRLELLRHAPCKVSDEQIHRLQQMGYRLQMLVSGHGLADGIAPEAMRALDSFGWTLRT